MLWKKKTNQKKNKEKEELFCECVGRDSVSIDLVSHVSQLPIQDRQLRGKSSLERR